MTKFIYLNFRTHSNKQDFRMKVLIEKIKQFQTSTDKTVQLVFILFYFLAVLIFKHIICFRGILIREYSLIG
jgi:hypothetical protein